MAPIPIPPPYVALSKILNMSLLQQSHLPPLQQLSLPPPICGEGLFVLIVFSSYLIGVDVDKVLGMVWVSMCMLCHGGNGIAGVAVVVVMMV